MLSKTKSGIYTIRQSTVEEWPSLSERIVAIEQSSMAETGYALPEDDLRSFFQDPHAINVIIEKEKRVVGFLCSLPLEAVCGREEVPYDTTHGTHKTIYISDIIFCPEERNRGIGTKMVLRLFNLASKSGYFFVAGHSMPSSVNLRKRLGAKTLYVEQNWADSGLPAYYQVNALSR
ncbi:MAG: GNAT family N-acetyltransferase [archaeon]